jgi:pimeloyl-ACP methyl ester carboxylesterase
MGCLLIGSIRSPAGLPWRWRLLWPVAVFGPDFLRILARLVVVLGRPVLGTRAVRRFELLSRPEAAFSRWAMCAVVRWQPSPAAQQVRVFHIHGEADKTLPIALVRPDVIVPGGPHALSLFCPSSVNKFIAEVVETVGANRSESEAPTG